MSKPPKKAKDAPLPPIIVKQVTVIAAGHHGGAWKGAYADFVTAPTEKQRQGIGEARFRKIEGVADREPLVRDKPEDPRNRRISILLMR